jgi:hypothetical protein
MTTEATFTVLIGAETLHSESKAYPDLRRANGCINKKNENAMLKDINSIKNSLNEKFSVGSYDVKLNVDFKTVENA